MNGSATFTETRTLSVEPASLWSFSLAPSLLDYMDSQLYSTTEIRRAGKDVSGGSSAVLQDNMQSCYRLPPFKFCPDSSWLHLVRLGRSLLNHTWYVKPSHFGWSSAHSVYEHVHNGYWQLCSHAWSEQNVFSNVMYSCGRHFHNTHVGSGYWHQKAKKRRSKPPQGNQEPLVVKDPRGASSE